MKETISIQYHRRPSDIYTLMQAFISRKSKIIPGNTSPKIYIIRENANIELSHLERFNSICEIGYTKGIHIVYPFTLVYPYLMRLLCRKEIPFSLFKVLNTKNIIKLHRTITPNEIFKINCRNSSVRMYNKGSEFDFYCELLIGNEVVWDLTATYYIRGSHKTGELSPAQKGLEPLNNPSNTMEWYLASRDRFRFAKISGDTNAIHYSSIYARMYGFKRDFAQPIRVISRCVSELKDHSADTPGYLEFHIKGPVYYNSRLILMNSLKEKSDRFDLFCEDNTRPCINGIIKR